MNTLSITPVMWWMWASSNIMTMMIIIKNCCLGVLPWSYEQCFLIKICIICMKILINKMSVNALLFSSDNFFLPSHRKPFRKHFNSCDAVRWTVVGILIIFVCQYAFFHTFGFFLKHWHWSCIEMASYTSFFYPLELFVCLLSKTNVQQSSGITKSCETWELMFKHHHQLLVLFSQ